ncbi:hypothetical protein FIBSPDRAFT_882282 [Athelia psychrophila]|uniref:Uncharacterized protein n=1 Tax=Athelia psychrophila TaxID=1759441 RepID=A0A166VRG2_9AGAM|nr:hypothetical protein FIBSPDRAFT_882282 [Fibularhizoctonia sp. CBS 109695]
MSHLCRGPSYRKPAPTFVPSPVPSPPSSPRMTSPAPRERILQSFEAAMDKEMPPLPSGWRDAIHKATSSDKRRIASVAPESVVIATPLSDFVTISRASSVYGSASGGEQDSSPSSTQAYLSDDYSFSGSSVSDYGVEVPVSTLAVAPTPITPSPRSEYRPPTPPLAAHPRRISGPTAPPNVQGMSEDPERLLAVPNATPRVKKPAQQSLRSASAQPVSDVEPRQISAEYVVASVPSSPVASELRETWFRDTWYILPVLPLAEETEDLHCAGKLEMQSPDVSHQPKSRFWGRIGMLGHMLKKLKHVGPRSTYFNGLSSPSFDNPPRNLILNVIVVSNIRKASEPTSFNERRNPREWNITMAPRAQLRGQSSSQERGAHSHPADGGSQKPSHRENNINTADHKLAMH